MSTRAIIQAASDDSMFLVDFSISHYEYIEQQAVLTKEETLRFMNDDQYIVIVRREEVELTFIQANICTLDEDTIKLLNDQPTTKGILEQIHRSMKNQ